MTLTSLRAHAMVAQLLMAKWDRSMSENKFGFLVQTTFPFLAEHVPYTIEEGANQFWFIIADVRVSVHQDLYYESYRQIWAVYVSGKLFTIDPRDIGAETQLWAILYPYLLAAKEDTDDE